MLPSAPEAPKGRRVQEARLELRQERGNDVRDDVQDLEICACKDWWLEEW